MKLLIKIGIYVIAFLAFLLGVAYFITVTYKEEILAAVNKEFSDRMNGELRIKDLDYSILETFPNFSFTLVEPIITDTLYAVHKQPMFRAEKVFMQFSLTKLLRNELDIQAILVNNGSVSLYKTKDGYDSWRIFKTDSAYQESASEKKASLDFMLNRVRLNNVAVSYVDSTLHADSTLYKTLRFHLTRLQANIDTKPDGMALDINGPVIFDQLTFNPNKGSFMKDAKAEVAFDLFYNKNQKNLQINESKVKVNKQEYSLTGSLQAGKVPVLSLTFHTDGAHITDISPLLTSSIAEKIERFKISQPVKATAQIKTLLKKGNQPEVEILFSINKSAITYKDKTCTDVSLNGKFYSKVDSTSKEGKKEYIEVTDFFGRYEKLPIQASFIIDNLKYPDIDLKSTIRFALQEANHLLDESKMNFTKGTANINFHYKGKIHKVLDEDNKKLPGVLQGKATLKNASFAYLPRQFQFAGINGSVVFNQSHASIDSLHFKVNENPVKISGKINDLVPFALYKYDRINANLQMHSPSFDFGNFKSPGTLRKLGLLKENKSQQAGTNLKKAIGRKLEALIENIDCHLAFSIDEVKYKQFSANQIGGNLTLEDNSIGLENIALQNSGGTLHLNGAIRNISQPKGDFEIQAVIQDADVRKLLHSFENFKQTTIGEHNLMGELHANIAFSSAFDDSYNILPQSMQGNFEVQLTNGRLIDFEPLTKIGKIVFKQRDFTNIEFADIRNNFELQGQDLHISRMEIASSVLNLFVEGIFSFNKETDMVIQLPLSNLSLKEEKDLVPEKIGVNQDAGASVYLRARAATGQEKVKITYDPFKKGLKEIRNEAEPAQKPNTKKRSRRQR
ncbi:AsmA-like C-terminal region-containing protein [Rhodocytophaga aerolata]|uniref:AsmA-like C-terminal region-containing protein n=1 Tax=Rhodocytophaga aerolata TaxID=455078 RepID=A0ABT8R1H3_9BACT|nr:AsmA-like C-terminal region-containing protein [Rhodocytophaga aerolata]MDO1445942.1 AsmA-like C-terminal region-containing protein [Rhodocytophaga aerolata]